MRCATFKGICTDGPAAAQTSSFPTVILQRTEQPPEKYCHNIQNIELDNLGVHAAMIIINLILNCAMGPWAIVMNSRKQHRHPDGHL